MKRGLTLKNDLIPLRLVGKTEAGSAEVQPARDSQLKATNCRWGGRYNQTCHPILPIPKKQFGALLCLKKPNKKSSDEGEFNIHQRQEKSLNRKVDLSNSR